LTQLDQEIFEEGEISFGESCSREKSSSIKFNATLKKSDSQMIREENWLDRVETEMTKKMWDCKRRMDSGYETAPECYRLWSSFTELHLLEVNIEPKIYDEHIFIAVSVLEPWYKKAVAYWHSWNVEGMKVRRVETPENKEYTLQEMINQKRNYKCEKSPVEADYRWSLKIFENVTGIETLYAPVKVGSKYEPVKMIPPMIWEPLWINYLTRVTKGRYPTSCVHHKDSVRTFDGVFYTSGVLNEKDQSYLLSSDCSSESRFDIYHKRISPEWRIVTAKILKHVIQIVPGKEDKKSKQLLSEETEVKVFVDGIKIENLKEQESVYISHDDKM